LSIRNIKKTQKRFAQNAEFLVLNVKGKHKINKLRKIKLTFHRSSTKYVIDSG